MRPGEVPCQRIPLWRRGLNRSIRDACPFISNGPRHLVCPGADDGPLQPFGAERDSGWTSFHQDKAFSNRERGVPKKAMDREGSVFLNSSEINR